MCDIASRIEADGKVIFLTDADVKSAIADGKIKSWKDGCGHSAILAMYPGLTGEQEEHIPCGREYAAAIRAGKVKKILATLGYKRAVVDEDGRWHCVDGPAYENGTRRAWYLNGQLHRVDGPAVEDGTCKEWYLNGQRHRVDGPAVEDGKYKEWYLNGQLHRVDGPAYENGPCKAWYLNGQWVQEPKKKAKKKSVAKPRGKGKKS